MRFAAVIVGIVFATMAGIACNGEASPETPAASSTPEASPTAVGSPAVASASRTTRATGGPDRAFAMGFADHPHVISVEGPLAAFGVIENEADLAALHFDGGLRWQEAFDYAAYPD